jgi:hypothetical protein
VLPRRAILRRLRRSLRFRTSGRHPASPAWRLLAISTIARHLTLHFRRYSTAHTYSTHFHITMRCTNRPVMRQMFRPTCLHTSTIPTILRRSLLLQIKYTIAGPLTDPTCFLHTSIIRVLDRRPLRLETEYTIVGPLIVPSRLRTDTTLTTPRRSLLLHTEYTIAGPLIVLTRFHTSTIQIFNRRTLLLETEFTTVRSLIVTTRLHAHCRTSCLAMLLQILWGTFQCCLLRTLLHHNRLHR